MITNYDNYDKHDEASEARDAADSQEYYYACGLQDAESGLPARVPDTNSVGVLAYVDGYESGLRMRGIMVPWDRVGVDHD